MKTLRHPRHRDEILARLRTLTPGAERRWGRMTAHQMVCHLCDTMRVRLGERATTPVGSALSHTAIKWVMLYTAAPIPQGVPTTKELNQELEGTRPRDFAADVATLVSLIERAVQPGAPAPNHHPFFGRFSVRQWGRFNWKHTDHHLRQFGA